MAPCVPDWWVESVSRAHKVDPGAAVPHECLQDDVYEGYNISKGTIMYVDYFTSLQLGLKFEDFLGI